MAITLKNYPFILKPPKSKTLYVLTYRVRENNEETWISETFVMHPLSKDKHFFGDKFKLIIIPRKKTDPAGNIK